MTDNQGMCAATTMTPLAYYGTAICELPPGHDGPHHSTVAPFPNQASYHQHPIGYDWADDEP